MAQVKDPNLLNLEDMLATDGYLKFSKVEGKQVFNIDMSKGSWCRVATTYFLKWNDVFFISLTATSDVVERLDKIKAKVKSRKSWLARSLKPQKSFQVVAKEEIAGSEGILAISRKDTIEQIQKHYKQKTLSNHNIEVTTSVSTSGGKEKINRISIPVEKTKGDYISDIELRAPEEPAKEIVDFYILTLKKLAMGEALDPERVREDYNAIVEKYAGDSDDADSVEDIFTEEGDLQVRDLEDEFYELAEKTKLKIDREITKNISNPEWLEQKVAELREEVAA